MLIRAKANRNVIDVSDLEAQQYVGAGIFEYVEEPRVRRVAPERAAVPTPEAGPSLASKTRTELLEMAAGLDVKGSGKDGYVTRADLVAALSGRYQRRDMRAED